tara:strand:- start:5909 stop:6409 length:501 start_codon:yes stop_codon:yes gene_type:complete
MYNVDLENQLIFPDIADRMVDYVSIQVDIDERRIKAASLIAQRVDIERIIGEANVVRCITVEDEELTDADEDLRELLVAPLCYYTYSRLLLSFQGNYTDSGFTNEQLAASRNEAKSVSKEMKSVAEVFMKKVITFLEYETPTLKIDETKLTPKIRVFGGKERRSSN